jgi:Ion channel
VPKQPITVPDRRRITLALGEGRRSFRSWQDRIRDPSLTVLLVLELCLAFLAAPLAAQGVADARPVAETLVLAVLAIVVVLSHRRGAIVAILLGLIAVLASLSFRAEWSPVTASVLRRGGNVITFSALTWVVAHAVYAPGRITLRRLQGAVVVYLNIAIIFAAAFSLIWDLSPTAFAGLSAPSGGPDELATMLYFSLTSLTTTGYGDIVPVNPFARSLANLESIVGQFYLAITVARLVTLEVEDRRRR